MSPPCCPVGAARGAGRPRKRRDCVTREKTRSEPTRAEARRTFRIVAMGWGRPVCLRRVPLRGLPAGGERHRRVNQTLPDDGARKTSGGGAAGQDAAKTRNTRVVPLTRQLAAPGPGPASSADPAP